MICVVKNTKTGVHRVHESHDNRRPLCGGGFQARQADWQQDFGECNCKRCLAICKRRDQKVATT